MRGCRIPTKRLQVYNLFRQNQKAETLKSPVLRDFDDAEREAVYKVILARRDIRSFLPEPIPDDVLERILIAAHHAPSVGYMQPWNFILIRDRERLKANPAGR